MRILVIIPSYKPAYIYGGPVQSVSALNEALVREGHNVCVLTSNANGKSNLEVTLNTIYRLKGVDVIYFQRWTGDHSNFSPTLLKAAWKQVIKADVVHIHAWWNLISIPTVLICILRGVRPVLSPRGSITTYTFSYRHSYLKSWFHALIGKNLLKKCMIHVTSPLETKDVSEYTGNAHIRSIPNLLELPNPVGEFQKDERTLSLIYVGRIDPKKNIEFLFEIIRPGFAYPCNLVFIGDGPEDYLEKLRRMSGENIRMQWLGPIYDESKWKHLASADVLLLPSKNENYGNVVLEALCQGTAVMLSPHVGLKEYVLANRLGWVPGDSPDEWREALNRIYSDRSELRTIRQKAPDCIKRDFDPRKMVQAYIELYQSAKLRS